MYYYFLIAMVQATVLLKCCCLFQKVHSFTFLTTTSTSMVHKSSLGTIHPFIKHRHGYNIVFEQHDTSPICRASIDTSMGYSTHPDSEPVPTAQKKTPMPPLLTTTTTSSTTNTAIPEKVKSASGIKVSSRTRGKRPSNVKMVTTLEEYKEYLNRYIMNKNSNVDVDGKIVVVRFYATWCKACQAIAPSFYRLARAQPDILFLEVPVTSQNPDIHQGLNVPSIPFGHVYHPDVGLVEERKLSKKYWLGFERTLKTYVNGFCVVENYHCDIVNGAKIRAEEEELPF